MPRLIEWDTLDVRVDGEKLNAMLATFRVDPIERMSIRLTNGLMRVDGSIRKFISVPFSIEIAELIAAGTEVRVPVRAASAFGGIPIPRFLFALAKERLPRGLVRFEEPATFVVSLERFLPQFVSADIQKIWIIEGGLSVTLGKGGADLPPIGDEQHGKDH